MEAGFFIPYNDTERWYREQLENTGIPYAMIMGRPRVQFNRHDPPSDPWRNGNAINRFWTRLPPSTKLGSPRSNLLSTRSVVGRKQSPRLLSILPVNGFAYIIRIISREP